MISWCAYCQTWQGEVPPLDSWEVSHGICAACLTRGVPEDPGAIQSIIPVANFLRALRREARRGYATQGADVLAEADKLGIRPLELLMGLLQPALDEIGKLWAQGEVTVAVEHRFSAMVQTVATLVLQRVRGVSTDPSQPLEFLLVNADGNHHTVGLLVVEAFLVSHGRTVLTLVPGLPAHEVVAQVRALQPKTLGISVSVPGELEMIEQVATALADLPPSRRPRLVVGGSAIRAGVQPDRALGFTVCTELHELLALPPTPDQAQSRALSFSGGGVTSPA